MIGSINQYLATSARIEELGKGFIYDGTTLDMVRIAVKNGAEPGYHIHSDLGCYIIDAAPHDDRAGGFWATRVWP